MCSIKEGTGFSCSRSRPATTRGPATSVLSTFVNSSRFSFSGPHSVRRIPSGNVNEVKLISIKEYRLTAEEKDCIPLP
jgi:hypothetical protein